MNRFNICIWGNKLTDTNRNLFDDPKQKSLEIAIVPNIQNVETQSYCSINSSQILYNLILNKLNTIFSFQAAKESNAFPCHVSPRCHAKVIFFILHKCISSSNTSVFLHLLCSIDGNLNTWTKTSLGTYHYILMDLFLHCVHHLWLCTVWNEVWTQHVITSITTDQNNQTLITSPYFQRNDIFRSNTQICSGSTSPGWPTVTPTPPLTAPQIVNSPTLTGEKMSRRRN